MNYYSLCNNVFNYIIYLMPLLWLLIYIILQQYFVYFAPDRSVRYFRDTNYFYLLIPSLKKTTMDLAGPLPVYSCQEVLRYQTDYKNMETFGMFIYIYIYIVCVTITATFDPIYWGLTPFFNNFSVIPRRPIHLLMHFLVFSHQYSTQQSSQATATFENIK